MTSALHTWHGAAGSTDDAQDALARNCQARWRAVAGGSVSARPGA